MKKNMLIILAILMTITSIFAMDIEIGNGTGTSTYIPFNGLYDYSWSTFIIDANQIGMAAEFNQIQFAVSSNPANYATVNQKVYFKETTDATVTASYPSPETSGFTLVYDGPVTWNGTGYQGIMLDTPFDYAGTSNLQVVWENHDGSWTSGYPTFLTTDVGTNVGVYNRTDTTFPTTDGTVVTYFPNIILSFAAENEPTMVTLVAPENNAMYVPTSTTLQWTMGQNTTNVDVYFSADRSAVNNMEASALVVNAQNVTSYQANDLTILTDYYWKVRSRNTANDLVVAGPLWKFSTEAGAGIVAVPVGDGTTTNYYYPFNFWYKNSIAETIYLAEEINIGGLLTNMSYFNSFSSNLPGEPITIWIGETTQSDLTDYIPASQLTEVFSGAVDFPAGQNTISIELDTPYVYSGGNLVVLTERPLAADYHSTGDVFFNTETDLTNRTIYWQSDSADYDPNAMTGGTRVNKMPNAVFYFIVEGMGSVSGTVTDGTTGLGGVDISIDNTNYHTVSLPDGNFEFAYVSEDDDYTLTASLHGYHDTTATFDVEEDEETIVNLTMTMLDNVEVSGQVITNDTGLGIQANVTLTGYEDYQVETNATGHFTIPGVYTSQTYTGRASAVGYQPGTFTAVVGEVDLALGTIMVTETLFPATGVVAELVGSNAVVTWNEPGAGGAGEWITKGAEENNDGIGTGAAAVISVSQMYTQAELADYQGMYINSIKFFPREASATYTLKVWGGATGNTELYSQAVPTFVNEAWNEVELTSSVAIPSAGPVYFGYVANTPTGYPAGCDAGPAVAGGDMIKLGDQAEWDVLSVITTIDVNWNLQAYVSWARGEQVASVNKQVMQKQTTQTDRNAQIVRGNLGAIANDANYSRAFTGYNVYRFLIADQDIMENWTLVQAATTTLTYTDTGWSALAPGFYKYGVKAVYTGGAEAGPAISNWLQNSVMTTVTVNVDSNVDAFVAGANIVLVGQTPNPNGEYSHFEGTTNATGVATIEVNTGMYDITISADGFTGYTGEVDATNDVSIDVTLEELTLPPSAVVAELVGENAVISWGTPTGGGSATAESFEEGFPPAGWTTIVNNTTESWALYETVPYATPVAPTDGTHQVGCKFDYTLQDEWLITPEMSCPNGDLTFDFYGHYGSVNGDNYYVKVSTDGINWTPIWNATDLPAADNHYDAPVVIDLGAYTGQNVKFAWNFVDGDGQGLWYSTFIDNIYFGGTRMDTRDLFAVSQSDNKTTTSNISNTSNMNVKRDASEVSRRVARVASPTTRNSNRAVTGYKVWRFLVADQATEANWTLLTATTVNDTTYTDATWSTQPTGFYKFAVKTVYTNNVTSEPAISNWLQNSEMSTVTVNVESNLGGPIADANIVLTAQVANPNGEFGVFEATTNAAGTATLSVNTGMYNAAITAMGFTSYAGEVNATTNVTVDVTLNEVALPPSGVVAEQEGADAVITWGEPGGAGGGEWITKGAEENNDGIGTGSAAVISVSQMYTQAELEDYQGMFINSIKFFPREGTSAYTLSVWGGVGGSTVLHSQAVTDFTNEAWNEVELTSSVAIPATGPVYFGYVANTPTGYPAGCDAGPAVAGGDMIKLGDQPEWDVLSVITTINVNWNLQAYVSWGRGATVASEGKTMLQRYNPNATSNAQIVQGNLDPIVNQTSTKITKATTRNDDRALVGYKVWRLLAIDQGNENNWTLLTPTTITDLTHTDTGWNGMTSGSYKFAVKAVYTNDNLSPAAFSNVLLKDMYGTVDGIVKNESDAPISGAVIHLDGRTATTNAQGSFEFLDVLAGDYDITATANGYASSTQNITVVGTQVTSAYFILATTNILISDSFETYPDFALTADPWVFFDGDLATTYAITNTDFLHSGEAMAYIIFNPSMTTPPLDDSYAAHTGAKFAGTFAANPGPNNDWMMTQEFTLGDTGTFNFWGKSVTAQYGMERFNVLVSTGSTNPNDFTSISGPTYVQAADVWTQYSYPLGAYANQRIRVAIQCVSDDAFIFMVDDVEIDAPGGTDNDNNEVAVAISALGGNYPNPFNPETTIAFSTKENGPVSLDIYNIRGQKVRSLVNENRESGDHSVVWNGKDDNGKSVASGVFFYRMKSGKFSSTKKMILMK